MKRQVVQNFLNLPGIAGIALIDGRSRPYFCGVDQTLNSQQRDALVQGIQQVVETTPPEFDSFSFRFSGCYVFIHKLDASLILLVLANDDLEMADYSTAIKELKYSLQKDISNAVATFRLLAGSTTLSRQEYWSPSAESTANGPKPMPPIATEVHKHPPPGDVAAEAVPTLEDAIAALNHLSEFTTHYLGKILVSSTWQTTRPKAESLKALQIDRKAEFSIPVEPLRTQPLTPEVEQAIQDWVAAFTDKCARIIRDYPTIVRTQALSQAQKRLLWRE